MPTRDGPEKSINDSHVISVAKADTTKRKLEIKSKPERFAHLTKPKGFANQREKHEGHGYAMALGYAADPDTVRDRMRTMKSLPVVEGRSVADTFG